ncbi:predicted protein [Coccidioides posadasii str. Silveira]|uniref:Predicted protein n=1 Tax=Coccidioides posadasii (strain RMSCC 757 / Silveira) TaxID=443226 RepID=E9DEI7_COCPS|nr:predicted protein [Coccidioides posadasii str. Silveira]
MFRSLSYLALPTLYGLLLQSGYTPGRSLAQNVFPIVGWLQVAYGESPNAITRWIRCDSQSCQCSSTCFKRSLLESTVAFPPLITLTCHCAAYQNRLAIQLLWIPCPLPTHRLLEALKPALILAALTK